MSEIFMTLCDRCRDRMGISSTRPENKYYLTEVPGSRRVIQCPMCSTITECTQYEAKSKAIVAMERAIRHQQRTEIERRMQKDTRARYREPWRGELGERP